LDERKGFQPPNGPPAWRDNAMTVLRGGMAG
jgi:hypothetical protein